ncbi:hypothetical protein KCP73_11675 [Salmonella enterica subsp. enterica]|nr:hypothetical protein KCP73_11675 [Salmonella enterica subsp. enterica]
MQLGYRASRAGGNGGRLPATGCRKSIATRSTLSLDASRFGQNGLGFWRHKDSKGKPKKEEDAAVDDLLASVSQPK